MVHEPALLIAADLHASFSQLPLLSLLLAVPLLGSLLILVWPGDPAPGRVRTVAIAALLLQLLLSALVWLVFDPQQSGMQLRELHHWVPGIGLDYNLGVDGLS